MYFIEKKLILKKIFEKYPNIKFQENPSSGSRVIHVDGWTNGQTGKTDRQTDTKKLTVGFHSFASEPEKIIISPVISINLSSVFHLY